MGADRITISQTHQLTNSLGANKNPCASGEAQGPVEDSLILNPSPFGEGNGYLILTAHHKLGRGSLLSVFVEQVDEVETAVCVVVDRYGYGHVAGS